MKRPVCKECGKIKKVKCILCNTWICECEKTHRSDKPVCLDCAEYVDAISEVMKKGDD